ncbi:MAG: amidase [Pseudomonadota bacterium]
MSETTPNWLDAAAALAAMAEGRLTPRALAAACLARIAEREAAVRAWTEVGGDALEAELARIEAIPPDARGPLWGLPVGVKDVFDTADRVTTYGSDIYADHRPTADAALVARLRAAGAVVLGKTVATEFAYWRAGATRNPHDLARSPGGSSSGSAAAVADGMVPLAFGSQTAASTIRPAAYCGVVGFKPSRGLLPTAGVKPLAPSFDTAGLIARRVSDVALTGAVLAEAGWADLGVTAPAPVLARWRGAEWAAASPAAVAAVEGALERLAAAGARIVEGRVPAPFDGITAAQTRLMAVEAAAVLAEEAERAPDRLSEPLLSLIEAGRAVPLATELRDRALLASAAGEPGPLFGAAEIIVAPAAMGEAPPLEQGTGSPDLSRAFTALGLPSVTLPCGRGPNGLPLGLQLAARPGTDGRLLAVAAWVERCLEPRPERSG